MATTTARPAAPSIRPRTARRWRLSVVALAGLLLVAVGAGAWVFSSWPGQVVPAAYNRGTNAVWLAHTWVEDPHSDAAIAALAARLRAGQMTDVYVHVGPLAADGSIPPERYPRAAEFAARIKAAHGGFLRVFAWIGQIESAGGGILDLSPPEIRQRIAATSATFTNQLGFDGIHYDIEPLFDQDTRFLALLEDTRRSVGDRPISVATGKWIPDGPPGAVFQQVSPDSALLTSNYYRQIAQRSDQVVPMLYDTGAGSGPWYQRIVMVQLFGILQATQGTGAAVVAGVPTYDRPTAGHDPASENLDWALPGVARAADAAGNPSHFAGVALYAHWETSQEEWRTYDHTWIGSDTRRSPNGR